VIALEQIASGPLRRDPYRWAEVDRLFAPVDGAALAATFPRDHYKLVSGDDGEKIYEYEARALIHMGADSIAHRRELSTAWQGLAQDFLSSAYRAAVSSLIGCDLTAALLEVNVFHYGPGASLGPHRDLPEKIVTHVLYFNRSWNDNDGGCLTILCAKDPTAIAAAIAPVVGNSVVLVRSDQSWHAVPRVINGCRESRRSLTATFYHPGSVSTMWPPADETPLHDYRAQSARSPWRIFSIWSRRSDLNR
jgi:SM-20-related protein